MRNVTLMLANPRGETKGEIEVDDVEDDVSNSALTKHWNHHIRVFMRHLGATHVYAVKDRDALVSRLKGKHNARAVSVRLVEGEERDALMARLEWWNS